MEIKASKKKSRRDSAVESTFDPKIFLQTENEFIAVALEFLQIDEDESTSDIDETEVVVPVKKLKTAEKSENQEESGKKAKDEIRRKILLEKRKQKKDAVKSSKTKNAKNKSFKTKRKEIRLQQKKLKRAKELSGDLNGDEALVKPKVKPVEKPVFNAAGKMVFSKFDFSSTGAEKEKPKKAEKDPRKLLEKITKQKKKIEQLEENNEKEQVELVKEKQAWQTALKRMKGEKVKDDPELLKKTIKKDKQMKNRSAKKWKERQENVAQLQKAKQDKRNENIAKKKEQKKANIKKKNIKKGRAVPGF